MEEATGFPEEMIRKKKFQKVKLNFNNTQNIFLSTDIFRARV